MDAQEAYRRLDALEHEATGQEAGCTSHEGGPGVERYGIQPHRIQRYMASNDPDFEKKAADVIGLYLKPPQHAAVFCVDEKTAIQALDRKAPILPAFTGSGRAPRVRIRPTWHTLLVCGPRHPDR